VLVVTGLGVLLGASGAVAAGIVMYGMGRPGSELIGAGENGRRESQAAGQAPRRWQGRKRASTSWFG